MAYNWLQTVVNGATNTNRAPIAPAAGSCIVVLSATSAGGGNPTVTFADSLGNAFTVAIAAVADAAGNWYSLHVLPNCVGGITFVAGTYNGGTPGTVNIWAIEYSGIATSSPLIGTPVQNHQASPGTVADAITGTALNVTAQPAAVIGLSVDESGLSFVAGTGYTQRSVSSANGGFVAVVEDKRITATGNNTATFTTTHGTDVFQSFTLALAEAVAATAQPVSPVRLDSRWPQEAWSAQGDVAVASQLANPVPPNPFWNTPGWSGIRNAWADVLWSTQRAPFSSGATPPRPVPVRAITDAVWLGIRSSWLEPMWPAQTQAPTGGIVATAVVPPPPPTGVYVYPLGFDLMRMGGGLT